ELPANVPGARTDDGGPLVDVVAGRAARRLATAASVDSVRRAGEQAPAGERSPRSTAEPAVAVATGGAEAVLAGQWASSVTGRPAPPELLARLSGMRPEHVDAPREAPRETVPEPPADTPASTRAANGSPAH